MSVSVIQLCEASSFMLVFASWLELTSAALTVPPRNTVVRRGERAQLICQTNVSTAASLSWKFTSVDGEKQKFIYNENGLNPDYRRRNVRVERSSSTGVYQLLFDAVQLDDAGTYTCQDDGGIGEPRAAWMAVLDGEPECAEPVTSSGVTMVTCNMAVNASNIHKPLESLEVRPIVVPSTDAAACRVSNESVTDDASQTTPRQFTVVVNLNSSTGTCSAPTITLNATTLSGKLVSTIDSELPDYMFPLPVSPQDSTTSPSTTISASEGVVNTASSLQLWLSLLLLLTTCLVLRF